jgi:hypothetical protein
MHDKKHEYEQLPHSPRWAQESAYDRLRTYSKTRARVARLPVLVGLCMFSFIMFVFFTGVCKELLLNRTHPDTDTL